VPPKVRPALLRHVSVIHLFLLSHFLSIFPQSIGNSSFRTGSSCCSLSLRGTPSRSVIRIISIRYTPPLRACRPDYLERHPLLLVRNSFPPSTIGDRCVQSISRAHPLVFPSPPVRPPDESISRFLTYVRAQLGLRSYCVLVRMSFTCRITPTISFSPGLAP